MRLNEVINVDPGLPALLVFSWEAETWAQTCMEGRHAWRGRWPSTNQGEMSEPDPSSWSSEVTNSPADTLILDL